MFQENPSANYTMTSSRRLLWGIALLQCIQGLGANIPYQIEPLVHNPGLYYERIDKMRLISKRWKLMLTVDLHNLLGQPLPGLQQVYKQYEDCLRFKIITTCRQQLGIIAMGDYDRELKRNQEHLQRILNATSATPPETRNKRAPLFGFIGTISRKLFGTMDYNDQEHIKKEIDRLYQDQSQITHLISNSTHIMQAEINAMKVTHNRNNQRLNQAEKQVNALVQQTNEILTATQHLEYLARLQNVASEAEYAARKYVETSRSVVDAIEDAKHGKLNPYLLSITQIITVATEIEKGQPNNVFPLAKTNLDHALLSQISSIGTAYHDSKFLVIIEIPLLTKTQMDIYRIIPCKTSQKIQGNRKVAAYIQPREEFLAFSSYKSQYLQFSREYLKTCIPLENCLACPRGQPLRKTGIRPTCEYQLFSAQDQDLTTDGFNLCDIKLTNDLSAQWTRLENPEGWLYSALQPEKLQITCQDYATYAITLNGSGLFHLHANCTAEVNGIILEGTGLIETHLTTLLDIPKNFSLPSLAPILRDQPKPIHPMSSLRFDPLPNTENDSIYEQNLQDTIIEVERIGQHHQEEYYHRIFTVTNGTITLIISVFLTVASYIAYRKGLFSIATLLCRCCQPRKKSVLKRRAFQPNTSSYEIPNTTISMPELHHPTLPAPPPPPIDRRSSAGGQIISRAPSAVVIGYM